jgi:hypothetical protein
LSGPRNALKVLDFIFKCWEKYSGVMMSGKSSSRYSSSSDTELSSDVTLSSGSMIGSGSATSETLSILGSSVSITFYGT